MRRLLFAAFLLTSACAAIAGFGDRPTGDPDDAIDGAPDGPSTDGAFDAGIDGPVDRGTVDPTHLDPTFATAGVFEFASGHTEVLASFPEPAGDLLWLGSVGDNAEETLRHVVGGRLTIDGKPSIDKPFSNVELPVTITNDVDERPRAIAFRADGSVAWGGVGIDRMTPMQTTEWQRSFLTDGGLLLSNDFQGSNPTGFVDLAPTSGDYVAAISGSFNGNRLISFSGQQRSLSNDTVASLSVHADRSIVVQLSSSSLIVGVASPTLADAGVYQLPISGTASGADSKNHPDSGAVVIGGMLQLGQKLFVVKLNASDVPSGSPAYVGLEADVTLTGIAFQRDKLVVAGCRNDSHLPWIARLDIEGSVPVFDPTFGTTGFVTLVIGGQSECPKSLVIDGQNRILLLLANDKSPGRIVRLKY